MSVRKYTLGIAFDLDLNLVLIKKTKPESQAGKYNFVGGKIERGETPVDCISREFHEETSVLIPTNRWKYVGKMYRSGDFIVHIFLTCDETVANVKTTTEEEVILVSSDAFEMSSILSKKLMPNLKVIYEFIKSDDFLDTDAELIIKLPTIDSEQLQ